MAQRATIGAPAVPGEARWGGPGGSTVRAVGATVSLSPGEQAAEPGQSATFTMRVRNTGSVVDEFTFEPIGEGAGWIRVEPGVLPLFPSAEETVRVVVTPPRDASSRAGPLAFAVKASSREDAANSAVAEATVQVQPFTDLLGELVPRTVRGRRRARAELAVDNRGNTPTELELEGRDVDGNVAVDVRPSAVTVEPGTASFAGVTVRPRRRFLRGPSKTHQYQVVGAPPQGEPLLIDGVMAQEAILPPWFMRALLATVLLLALLVGLWFALLKPTVESAAEDAAEAAAEEAIAGPLAQQAEQISALEQATTGTTTPSAVGGDGEPEPGGGLLELGEPFDTRLAASALPGQAGDQAVTVGGGQVLSITDVFLQNPQGDAGRLRIRRGEAILLEVALQNFRDLDYHFVSPLTFSGGQTVVLEVACELTASDRCRAGAYLTGFLETLES